VSEFISRRQFSSTGAVAVRRTVCREWDRALKLMLLSVQSGASSRVVQQRLYTPRLLDRRKEHLHDQVQRHRRNTRGLCLVRAFSCIRAVNLLQYSCSSLQMTISVSGQLLIISVLSLLLIQYLETYYCWDPECMSSWSTHLTCVLFPVIQLGPK